MGTINVLIIKNEMVHLSLHFSDAGVPCCDISVPSDTAHTHSPALPSAMMPS